MRIAIEEMAAAKRRADETGDEALIDPDLGEGGDEGDLDELGPEEPEEPASGAEGEIEE